MNTTHLVNCIEELARALNLKAITVTAEDGSVLIHKPEPPSPLNMNKEPGRVQELKPGWNRGNDGFDYFVGEGPSNIRTTPNPVAENPVTRQPESEHLMRACCEKSADELFKRGKQEADEFLQIGELPPGKKFCIPIVYQLDPKKNFLGEDRPGSKSYQYVPCLGKTLNEQERVKVLNDGIEELANMARALSDRAKDLGFPINGFNFHVKRDGNTKFHVAYKK